MTCGFNRTNMNETETRVIMEGRAKAGNQAVEHIQCDLPCVYLKRNNDAYKDNHAYKTGFTYRYMRKIQLVDLLGCGKYKFVHGWEDYAKVVVACIAVSPGSFQTHPTSTRVMINARKESTSTEDSMGKNMVHAGTSSRILLTSSIRGWLA